MDRRRKPVRFTTATDRDTIIILNDRYKPLGFCTVHTCITFNVYVVYRTICVYVTTKHGKQYRSFWPDAKTHTS